MAGWTLNKIFLSLFFGVWLSACDAPLFHLHSTPLDIEGATEISPKVLFGDYLYNSSCKVQVGTSWWKNCVRFAEQVTPGGVPVFRSRKIIMHRLIVLPVGVDESRLFLEMKVGPYYKLLEIVPRPRGLRFMSFQFDTQKLQEQRFSFAYTTAQPIAGYPTGDTVILARFPGYRLQDYLDHTTRHSFDGFSLEFSSPAQAQKMLQTLGEMGIKTRTCEDSIAP